MARWKAVLFSRTFLYPLLAMAILVGGSAWYYNFAAKRSETIINERSLHVLSALAGELSSRLASLDTIAHRPWDPSQLRGQVSDLDMEEKCPPQEKGAVADRKLSVSDYKLQILVEAKVGAKPSCWSIPFDRLMSPLEKSLPQGIFEDLLLADDKGRVLYQTRRSGMEISDLAVFFQEAEKPKAKAVERHLTKQRTGGVQDHEDSKDQKQNSLEQREELAARLATSKLTDVELGGEPYKLYTVPVPGPAQVGDPAAFSFVVGGILHERAFQSERVSPLANTLVTIGFFLLLVGAGAYPILRFRLMGPAEVLRKGTGLVFALQILLTAIVVGGLAGHLIFSSYEDQTDKDLDLLATSLERHLVNETRDALDMLCSLEGFYKEHHPVITENKVSQGKTCSNDVIFAQPSGEYDWTAGILNKIRNPSLYPYFDHAFFADRAGFQEIKFSASSSVTPEVRRCDSEAFSQALLGRDLWHFRDPPGDSAPGFWMEPDYSTTSAKYLVWISRPSAAQLHEKAPVAVMVTGLVSLSQAVFPPDYGFAIVDRNGKVLFHSTRAKNGRENFADACDRSRRLHDLFETRETGTLETSYLGIRHRVLVRPIDKFANCPWSLVVFRDLTAWDEDHFDSVLMFLSLSGSYFVFLLIAGWLAGCAKKPASWIWPTQKDRPVYWRIFWVLIAANVFNFRIFRHCDETQLWVTACMVPLVAVVLIVLRLKSRSWTILFVSAAIWLIMAVWTGQQGGWVLSTATTGPTSVSFWLAFSGLCCSFACLALPFGWPDKLRSHLRKGMKSGPPEDRIPKSDRPSLATVYALPATALLFTMGFIPAIRLFNASVLFQSVVAARRSQLELAGELKQRQERISEGYFGRYGDEIPARGDFHNERLNQETRDLYYLDVAPPFPASGHYRRSHRPERLMHGISSLVEHEGRSPRRRSGLLSPNAGWVWCEDGPFGSSEDNRYSLLMLRIDGQEEDCHDMKGETGTDYHNRWVVTELPERVLYNLNIMRNPLVLFESILPLLMIVVSFFALQYAIRRLFVLDWGSPQEWPKVEISAALNLRATPFERHVVLLGAPRTGKTEMLKQCSGVRYIDLVNDPRFGTEDPAPGPDEVVVLDHFEHHLQNGSQGQRILRSLERLVYELKCRIVIVATVDPLYYFDQVAEGTDVERWTSALASFQVVQATNPSSIKGEQYFALLWQTCSDEERVALHQIAMYGWINCLQEPALTHLALRGLLVNGPRFEIADPGFADHVQRSCTTGPFVVPEKSGSEDSLNTLRLVLVVVAIVFIAALAYVWGDQTVAYVATGASALTAASRAFAKSKGRGSIGEPKDFG